MNVYEAIMKAADFIERYPDNFNFWSGGVPSSCGSPGCALGWIGYFAGVPAGASSQSNVPAVLGIAGDYCTSSMEFYSRMSTLNGDHGWKRSASQCANALRLYAAKYHGHVTRNFARELYEKVSVAPRIPEEA